MQNLYVNPSLKHSVAAMEAPRLQNEAQMRERQGDFAAAERLYLRAIEIRNEAFGPGNSYVAINQNSLGELYIKINRLDDAEAMLNQAMAIRTVTGPPFDAAVTRDNLARVFEMRGNLDAAREMRLRGSPDQIACGHYKCPGQTFSKHALRRCSRCKSILYCSKGCQTSDWKRHKQYCMQRNDL
ncbi:hypothetical protein BV25DRAFT_1987024 [Artomyces pyxidatus]|uniref:Uncharacterized protein n=1 Tax=Artomyces pyxidatus TaxID=48021 RepID=A0ACB8TIE7_9AGAM|nr:hypothetical protein BV25DRAFT_1987024 [Artomyces pyxidatus]